MNPIPQKPSQRIHGRLLVTLQFSLLLVLILITAPWAALQVGRVSVVIVMGCAVAVGTASLVANRPGNFNIRPEPKFNGRLIEQGVYGHVRHPMYTAVMLFGLACVLSQPSVNAGLAAGLLTLVLWLKARAEERALQTRYPTYAAYMRRTTRFIPRIL
ncbi:MAG: methyltransferase family protein [Burkholderiaceae bacterium]